MLIVTVGFQVLQVHVGQVVPLVEGFLLGFSVQVGQVVALVVVVIVDVIGRVGLGPPSFASL